VTDVDWTSNFAVASLRHQRPSDVIAGRAPPPPQQQQQQHRDARVYTCKRLEKVNVSASECAAVVTRFCAKNQLKQSAAQREIFAIAYNKNSPIIGRMNFI